MQPPTNTELTLILSWIENAQSFDAWEEVNEMVADHPEEAWRLIREMIDVAPNDLLLFGVAAGPLEDLLHRHGKAFAARVKKAAATDSQFHKCLAGVWLSKPKWLARSIGQSLTAKGRRRRRSGDLPKTRARFIARWFHHSETIWASCRLEELTRTEPEYAWRILLLLVKVAKEEYPEVLDDVDVHAFDTFVRLRGSEIYERVVAEARGNEIMRTWIEKRRRWKHPDEAWRGLLEHYQSSLGG